MAWNGWQLDITEENAQKDFENMKKLYSKRRLQLKKVERSGSSAQNVQKARSALEELISLAWLNPHVKMRTTFTYIDDVAAYEDTQSVDQSEHYDFEQYTDPHDSSFELTISSNTPTSDEQASTVNSAGAGMKRKLQSSSVTKRPKCHQKEGMLKSQDSDLIKTLNHVIEQPGETKDEHAIFDAYVAASFRKFRPNDQAIARVWTISVWVVLFLSIVRINLFFKENKSVVKCERMWEKESNGEWESNT